MRKRTPRRKRIPRTVRIFFHGKGFFNREISLSDEEDDRCDFRFEKKLKRFFLLRLLRREVFSSEELYFLVNI